MTRVAALRRRPGCETNTLNAESLTQHDREHEQAARSRRFWIRSTPSPRHHLHSSASLSPADSSPHSCERQFTVHHARILQPSQHRRTLKPRQRHIHAHSPTRSTASTRPAAAAEISVRPRPASRPLRTAAVRFPASSWRVAGVRSTERGSGAAESSFEGRAGRVVSR